MQTRRYSSEVGIAEEVLMIYGQYGCGYIFGFVQFVGEIAMNNLATFGNRAVPVSSLVPLVGSETVCKSLSEVTTLAIYIR